MFASGRGAIEMSRETTPSFLGPSRTTFRPYLKDTGIDILSLSVLARDGNAWESGLDLITARHPLNLPWRPPPLLPGEHGAN